MSKYKIHKFPKSRIATIDVCAMGKKKHHVSAFLEMDVTLAKEKIKKYKKDVGKISFIAWLIKVIGHTVADKNAVAAYLAGKQKTIYFADVNISFLIEKEINGEKVPLPLVIEKANTLKIETITQLVNSSKQETLSNNQVVIQKRSTRAERFYYHLPGFVRRTIWKFMLKRPKMLFEKMGNVAVTSLGMYGKINGWFVPISIHPVCFGIGSVMKKPVVKNDNIEIRDILNLTVMIDHDVIDGGSMARFISALNKNIEAGMFL
jgi:pyruvate/2-oxoglutarate dehydrogenase complex dihydrolipoamide acyltransferase (E2) component